MAGGPEAFARIVQRYQDAVFGIALARLGNFHEAQDVAQQVFLDAFQRLGALRNAARLGAWLRSMAIHMSIDRIRRRTATMEIEHAAGCESSDPAPPVAAARTELRTAVLEAIARLSVPQRETTMLFYIDGYSVEKVAAIQEVPVGTVKRRLHDARQRLKAQMIGMVEEVLKFQAPTQDFAQKVFSILCQYHPAPGHVGPNRWHQSIDELRSLGGRGMEGFLCAGRSPHSPTRVFAVHMLQSHHAALDDEPIIQLLLAGLADPNRKVRSHCVQALLRSTQPAERKRREFVPRMVPLLADPSKRVRRHVAFALAEYWPEVPLAAAAAALAAEIDNESRKCHQRLVHAIVSGGEMKWFVQ